MGLLMFPGEATRRSPLPKPEMERKPGVLKQAALLFTKCEDEPLVV